MSAPDRDLELLEAVLRKDAPQPDPAFAREIDRRLSEGFARPRRLRFPPLIPALVTATALLIAAAVGVAVLGGGDKTAKDAADIGPELAAAPPTAARAGPSDRKVERSVQMTIAAARGELEDAAGEVGEITSAHRGYVLGSVLSTGTDGRRSGQFTLRIPSAQVEPALADLGRLGEVRSRDESSQDMTAPYAHVQDKLSNALLEQRETVDRLREASGVEAERLRSHLRAVAADVRKLSSQMRLLRRKTAMSTVTVRLEEKQRHDGGGIVGGGPGDALDDALAVLSGTLNLAIRMLPLALLVLLAWAGTSAMRRRRRTAVLF